MHTTVTYRNPEIEELGSPPYQGYEATWLCTKVSTLIRRMERSHKKILLMVVTDSVGGQSGPLVSGRGWASDRHTTQELQQPRSHRDDLSWTTRRLPYLWTRTLVKTTTATLYSTETNGKPNPLNVPPGNFKKRRRSLRGRRSARWSCR